MTPPPHQTSLRKKFKRARQIIKYTNILANLESDEESIPSSRPGTVENDSDDFDSIQTEGPSSPLISSLRRKSAAFKRNKQLPVQNESEAKLFELAELGDVTGIRNLLFAEDGHLNRNIDINKPNLSGYTILHVAVQRGDETLVQLLLSIQGVDIQDTLFYAIKEQSLTIVKMILNYEVASTHRPDGSRRSRVSLHSLEQNPSPEDLEAAILSCTHRKNEMGSEFDEDVTPVMLAAQVGSYQLIKFFHDYGSYMPASEDIHAPGCKCVPCKTKGPVGMALTRLHYFMAVANAYYMIFLANRFQNYDPVLTAFNLVKKLEEYKRFEHELHVEYDELIMDLKKFATDLLGLCRTTSEVETLLNQKNGYEGDKRRFPRLFLAVIREQKEFVTHPHAQEALTMEWLGWWPEWQTYSFVGKISQAILRLPVVVFGGFWLVFDDKSQYSKRFTAPVCRFLNSVASYMVFLILLILAMTLHVHPDDESVPKSIGFAIIEWLIIVFALGHICSTLKQLSVMPRTFISMPWNWYDIATHVAFIVTFVFWFISWTHVRTYRYRGRIRIIQRKRENWEAFHPLLIAEGFFAIAAIFSFGRVLRLFHMSPRLGPMQIYLGNMMRQGGLPVVLSLLFIFAAATGLTSLYKDYKGVISDDTKSHAMNVDEDAVAEEPEVQGDYMTTIPYTMHSLLWAMLGLPNLDEVKIVAVKVPSTGRHPEDMIHHVLTQTVGTIIYAMFLIVAATVMLNTVISMMTGAGAAAVEDRDMEWKFARSQMYIFIGSDTKVPSPYNIFRLWVSFSKFLASGQIGKMFGLKKKRVSSPSEVAKYARLIKELVRRYFYDKAEASLKENATTDQVTSLRETVSGLKDKYKSLSLGAYLRDRRTKPVKPEIKRQRRGLVRQWESERGPQTIVEEVNEIIDSGVRKLSSGPPFTPRSKLPSPSPTSPKQPSPPGPPPPPPRLANATGSRPPPSPLPPTTNKVTTASSPPTPPPLPKTQSKVNVTSPPLPLTPPPLPKDSSEVTVVAPIPPPQPPPLPDAEGLTTRGRPGPLPTPSPPPTPPPPPSRGPSKTFL